MLPDRTLRNIRILGLDISTKTGWAVIDNGILYSRGRLGVSVPKFVVTEPIVKDYYILHRAQSNVEEIISLINSVEPDYIYIEQTNTGRNRYTQKELEFMHCLLLSECDKIHVLARLRYIDTSQWRSRLRLRLNKAQKKHNGSRKKDKASRINVGCIQVRGRVTPKHLAVGFVNEHFQLNLKLKDHDTAEAICIAYCGWQAQKPDTINGEKNEG